MKGLGFTALAASILLTGAAAEETFTVTHTNYITPACFQQQYKTALDGNPESLTTGIPVVFRYANEGDDDQPENFVSTEYLTHTKCSQKICFTSTETKQYTKTVTPTVKTDEASAATAEKSKSKARSTLYVYDTATANDDIDETVTGAAKTTTKTIFKATETPEVIYKPSTSVETITQTMRDPLVTASSKSKELSHTIEESSFTAGATISAAAKVSTADSSSNSTTAEFNNSSASTTSTIDLRISSTLLTVAPTNKAAAVSYGNSSTVSSSVISAYSNSLSSAVSSASIASSGALLSSSSASSASSATSASSASSALSSSPGTGAKAAANSAYSGDLFKAIASDEPLSLFPRKELPLSIPSGVSNDNVPYETNKFFVNLFLDDQTDMIWSYPYGMYWKKTDYYGFAVQHTNKTNRVFGSSDTNNKGVDSYYFNPILDGELIFSATSLTKDANKLTVSNMKSMSALVQLSEDGDVSSNYVEIPVVQGMGFVSAIYHGDLVAELNSMVGFDEVTQESSSTLNSNVLKYRVKLFNGIEWLAYVTLPKGSSSDFKLSAKSSYSIEGSKAVDGLLLQIAVAPSSSSDEKYYDQAAGQYAVSASVEGQVSSGTSVNYSFKYETKGSSSSGKTIVFALPHHLDSLTGDTKSASTGIELTSTTKGDMTGFLTNELSFSETLTSSQVSFLPWTSQMKSALSYTKDQLQLLAKTANSELSVDINNAVNSVDSTYSSGKVLDKYAYILLVVSDIIGDDDVAKDTLSQLKDAVEVFTSNKQYYPFMYDTKFGGITSTAAQNGDTGADYGAPYYNDHHFHYGYFVHAAAVIGYIDKKYGGTWAEDNKEWVNSLVRDVANPSEDDKYFPVSRMFDWFAGHSWASGLFASGDGRNEESSSEDYNFAYGMKMWGNVIGDGAMEARGDLMISIMSRAMNKYFYYTDDNTVEPKEIIANKVSGIFFDNKVAYTTYFGSPSDHPEYVHGIHMLPITPVSSIIRGPTFVEQEWDQQISKFIDNVNSGWTGILKLNQALYDPKSSYSFFSSSDWSSSYLDDGQSRTWSLAFSGGVSNSI
ncbi:Endo-13 [Meyerozyma sp. JA9]|nr:Endo-13 [Meyerozyma sp. JA9]